MTDVGAYEFPRLTRRDNGVLFLEMNQALHTELSGVWTDIDADGSPTVNTGV